MNGDVFVLVGFNLQRFWFNLECEALTLRHLPWFYAELNIASYFVWIDYFESFA